MKKAVSVACSILFFMTLAFSISGCQKVDEKNPISVVWGRGNAGWTAHLRIPETATEIFYRPDPDLSFKSTGQNDWTGKPEPVKVINIPFTDKPLLLWVKYKDRKGREMGPWTFTLDPVTESARFDKRILNTTRTGWLGISEYQGKTMVYFTHLLACRSGISHIYYGIDKEIPDMKFEFLPNKYPGMVRPPKGEKIFIEVPSGTKFVTVRLVYADQTQSDVEKFTKRDN